MADARVGGPMAEAMAKTGCANDTAL